MAPFHPNFARRILLVDEDIYLRTTLARLLTGEGYEVCHADSGEEAISVYGRRPLALVVTQLVFGGKDSFEIIAEMRRELVCDRFIATARAGWLPADLCARAAEYLGAQCVLVKPFQPEHLLAAVRDAFSINPNLPCLTPKRQNSFCLQP
jgi:DNA-binding response OmpR family regulator